jgi:hypothetical protein
MDPINPWLDPGETRRMAERLRGPARQIIAAPDDAGFDDAFVGYSRDAAQPAEPPLPPLPTPLPPPPAPVSAPPAPADAPVAPSCPHFGWLSDQFGASGHFILDATGALQCSDGPHAAYHFLARDLARAGAPAQHVRVRILANAILEIIPVETPAGLSWLGIIVPAALSADALRQIHLRWPDDGAGE